MELVVANPEACTNLDIVYMTVEKELGKKSIEVEFNDFRVPISFVPTLSVTT